MYVQELVKANLSSTVKLMLEKVNSKEDPKFLRFYMCLQAVKHGFVSSCRPIIGLDGCHLNGIYNRQLLVVVVRDPNDQYFPLAIAVVESKTKESWLWFLTILLEDIG